MSQLAAGFKTIADNGRERKTDGLWTHLGMMVTGGAGPAGPPSDGRVGLITLGQGQFQINPPALSNLTYSQGQIQMLSQVGSPVSLGFHEAGSSALALYKPVGSNGPLRIRQSDGIDYPLAGAPGSVTSAMIAANAVQQQIGAYIAAPTFNTAVAATWVLTPIAVPITTSGGLLRIEFSSSFSHSVANGQYMIGFGYDGNVANSMCYVTSPIAGSWQSSAFCIYITLPAGPHTIQIFVYLAVAGTVTVTGSSYSTLYVTEQKR